MERNTVIAISKLQLNDRFYKKGDAKKSVFTKVAVKTIRTKWSTLMHGALQDGCVFPVHMKNETLVIFLRHAITQ